MKVKICGITRPEDAQLAVALGADALGFILWPNSPRATSADAVRRIVDTLPPFVSTVGVFVNQPVDEVTRAVRTAGLTTVQLHGDEDARAYGECGARLVKAVAVGPGFDVASVDEVPDGVGVLLDAHDPVKRGGTGRPIDWDVAVAAARRRPIILSGGLRPDNIARAVEIVAPYAVDVSSGVESAPGMKDDAKLRALFAALARVSNRAGRSRTRNRPNAKDTL